MLIMSEESYVTSESILQNIDVLKACWMNEWMSKWVDFTASLLVSLTLVWFLGFVPQLAPWCARSLLWGEQEAACATLGGTDKTPVFLQHFGCTNDVSAAGVCVRLTERLHKPHFPCRRHRNCFYRGDWTLGSWHFSLLSVLCSRWREPTDTLGLCCIWFWRTTRSGLSLSSDCTRRPSLMYLSWFSVLPPRCLVWTRCCSMTR